MELTVEEFNSEKSRIIVENKILIEDLNKKWSD